MPRLVRHDNKYATPGEYISASRAAERIVVRMDVPSEQTLEAWKQEMAGAAKKWRSVNRTAPFKVTCEATFFFWALENAPSIQDLTHVALDCLTDTLVERIDCIEHLQANRIPAHTSGFSLSVFKKRKYS